jgi:hypothetical protein
MLLVAGFDQFTDQRRGGRKADTVAALTGSQTEGPGGRISRPILLHTAPNRPPVRLDFQPDNAQMN